MVICRDPEREFEVHEETCQAKAVIDRRRDEQAKATTDPEPGVVLSARLEADDGEGFAVNPFL